MYKNKVYNLFVLSVNLRCLGYSKQNPKFDTTSDQAEGNRPRDKRIFDQSANSALWRPRHFHSKIVR